MTRGGGVTFCLDPALEGGLEVVEVANNVPNPLCPFRVFVPKSRQSVSEQGDSVSSAARVGYSHT